jgi:predicted flap endonuclease-1-like 5' DNA nuclease
MENSGVIQAIEANWPMLALVLAAIVLLAWWLWSRSAKARRVRAYRPDVLDEGVGPAQRNQALIDAAPAAAVALPSGGASGVPVDGDDLSRIKGLGPKLQALLPTLGLSTYAQIAALDDAGLAELDSKLGAFAGRPARDNWVAQAKFLTEGDVAGFEAQFGKV